MPELSRWRPAWAEIDVDALRQNVQLLCDVVAPSALCAVVKADGYGHGAPAVAEAALEAGASHLAVALVEEGEVLRRAGVEAPVVLLSEPPTGSEAAVVELRLEPTVASRQTAQRLAAAVGASGGDLRVHLKVDTGMHRAGVQPAAALELAEWIQSSPALTLAGVCTHLAVADEGQAESQEYTTGQLERLDHVLSELADRGIDPGCVHVANSAAAIAHPAARRSMVRCGIAVYGQPPSSWVVSALEAAAPGRPLRPVLSLKAQISAVRSLAGGERPSYGRRRALPGDALVATVPLGYADGVRRGVFQRGSEVRGMEVLLRGRRRPVAGTVTMDQLMVDCQEETGVSVGEEVVLLGRQGDELITAAEWAEALGTINYEILTGIGPRVPRVTVGRTGRGGRPRPDTDVGQPVTGAAGAWV